MQTTMPPLLVCFKIAQAFACPIPNRWSARVTSSAITPKSDWDPETNNTVPFCLTDTWIHPVLQPAPSRLCTQYCHYRSGWKLRMQEHLNQSIFNFTLEYLKGRWVWQWICYQILLIFNSVTLPTSMCAKIPYGVPVLRAKEIWARATGKGKI